MSWHPPPPSQTDRTFAAETAVHTAVPTGTVLPDPPPASCASGGADEASSLWDEGFATIGVDADDAAERLRRATLRNLDRGSDVEVEIATGSREIASALRLVHDVYVAEGYMEPHPLGMRILLPHHALKSTLVIVARQHDEIVGTLSLIFDGPAGLPMDELYPEALGQARRAGRRIVECGNFAIAKNARRGAVVLHLMRTAVRLARAERHDDLYIAVHPKHVAFYRTIWLMEPFGDVASYREVRGAPAIGMRGDLNVAPELLLFFYGYLPRNRNLFTFVFDSPERRSWH